MKNLPKAQPIQEVFIFKKRVTIRIGFSEGFKLKNLPKVQVIQKFFIFKNE